MPRSLGGDGGQLCSPRPGGLAGSGPWFCVQFDGLGGGLGLSGSLLSATGPGFITKPSVFPGPLSAVGPGDTDLLGQHLQSRGPGTPVPLPGQEAHEGGSASLGVSWQALCRHSPTRRGVGHTSPVAKQDPRQVVAQGGRLRKRPSLSWPGLTALLWGGLQALGEACGGVRRHSPASLLHLAGGSALDRWSRPGGQRPGRTAAYSHVAPPMTCLCRPPDTMCEGPGRGGAGLLWVGVWAAGPGPRQGRHLCTRRDLYPHHRPQTAVPRLVWSVNLTRIKANSGPDGRVTRRQLGCA